MDHTLSWGEDTQVWQIRNGNQRIEPGTGYQQSFCQRDHSVLQATAIQGEYKGYTGGNVVTSVLLRHCLGVSSGPAGG